MWLAVFSAVYMVASWAALPFGARGLIAANCLNFLIRIVYSAHCIRAFLRRARVLEAEVALKTLAKSHDTSSDAVKSVSGSLLDSRAFLRRIALARGSVVAFILATAGVWTLYAALSIGSVSLSGLPASSSAISFAPNAGDIRSVTASLNRLSAVMAYIGHIGAGAALVGLCAFTVWQCERAFVADMRKVFGK